jgi:PAS domain S-box-containing protein
LARTIRLRTYLLLLVAVVAVPLVVLSALGVVVLGRDHQGASRASLLGYVRTLAQAVDRELDGSAAMLELVADTAFLAGAPPEPIARLAAARGWLAVSLLAPDGRLVGTTAAAPDTAAGAAGALARAVVSAGGPVAHLVPDLAPPRVLVGIPRLRDGRVGHVLAAELDTARFRELLMGQTVAAGGTVLVADAERRVVAVGARGATEVGKSLPAELAAEVRTAGEAARRVARPAGDAAYVAWSRAPRSGWVAAVVVPAATFEGKWRTTVAWLGAGGLALLAVAGALALLLGRRLSSAVVRVGELARSLGSGEPPGRQPGGGVREVRELGAALCQASTLLRERERDRDRAHVALRDSTERLSLALGLAGMGTWDLDLVSGLTFWDAEHFRIFGYDPPPGGGAVPLERWRSHLHPADRERVLRAFEAARSSGKPYDPEYRIIRADDGREVWVGVNGRVLYDERGQPVRMLGVMTDITARKRAELALRETRQRLELTLDAGGLGSWQVDLATGALECSTVCRGTLGLPPRGELTWAAFLGAVHADDRVRVRTLVDRAIAEQVLFEAEHRVVRPDGQTRWVLARGRADYGPDGRPRQMVGVLLDVTARKEAELALEDANRAKDEFLAMLGHELRNPLGAISNAVAVLEQLEPGDVRASKLRTIVARQTRHLGRLVDDLLDVSRLTSGRIALQLQPVDLAEVADRALQALRHAARTGDHDVTLAVEHVLVAGDPTRLEQVVLNLVDNAVKYTAPGGRIHISVDREGREATLRVRDTGVGLPADLLPRVFDLFRRGQHSRQHGREGLGIGLSLVKRLTEMHGGSVTASSPGPGQGSEFVVRLPALPPGAALAEPGVRAPARRPQRVLVIEDHQDVRDGLRIFLETHGHSVDEATDGPTGLDKLMTRRPDIALVDVGLPGLDGYAIAAAARNSPGGAGVRLVAMTGYGQPDDRRRALEAGFDAHLVKPVDLQRLLALMDADESAPIDAGARR